MVPVKAGRGEVGSRKSYLATTGVQRADRQLRESPGDDEHPRRISLRAAMSHLRNKLSANRKGTKLIGTEVGIGYVVSKQS